MPILYDGGIHNRPKPAPAPPPAQRTGTADRMEREAQTPPRAEQAPASPPPLRTAARETERRVEVATAARADADALQALPPAAQAPLRGEIEQARTEAVRAEVAAERAAAAEIDVARLVLSPAYFERYVDDLQADQRHPAVQRAVAAARTPPPAPDPLQAGIDTALRAQAEADRLLQQGGPSDSYIEHVVMPAVERARQAWDAVGVAARDDLQRTHDRAQMPNAPGPTVDERARALIARAPASAQLAEVISTAAARTSGDAIAADVARTYRDQGADAAVRRLDRLTEGQRPEVARDALGALGGTLDAIGADLGARAEAADTRGAVRGQPRLAVHPQDRYDQAIGHLANVSYLASLAPGGADAAQGVADALARHVDPRNIGRLDEALGLAVRRTGAGTLAIGVADALQRDIQRAGSERKADQADDVLQNVEAGLKGLMEDSAAAAAALADDPVFRLVSGYSVIRLPDADLAAALKAHLDSHETEAQAYQAALAEVDRLGLASLRAAASLRSVPPALAELEHGRKLGERFAAFQDDATSAFAIGSSQGAAQHLDLMLQAAGPEGEAPLFATLAAGTGVARSVQEAIGGLWIKRTLAKAYALVDDKGDVNAAAAELDKLKGHGRLFGVNDARIDAAVDALKANVQASGGAGVTPERLTEQARQLDEDLADLGFDADTFVGRSFRALGVGLSFAGFVESGRAVFADGTEPAELLQATVAGAGLGKDGAELFAADARLLQTKGWQVGGAGLAGIGVVIDVVSMGRHIGGEDLSRAGLDLVSAAGGGLGVWATLSGGAALGGWAGPIGLGLVALAAGGRFLHDQYDRVHDANLLENQATEDYLQAMGFDPKLTRHLRNADSEGRSALPALAALARSYGYDLADPDDAKAFVTYINGYAEDDARIGQLGRLVEAAHQVDRREDGSFETELTQDERYQMSGRQRYSVEGRLPAALIDSIAGLRAWLDDQAAEGRYVAPPAR